MKLPEIPLVTLYGRLPHPGAIIRMVPPILGIEIDDVLIATQSYVFEIDSAGRFSQAVLPTNVGVDTPWMYSIDAGGKSARIAIPWGVGAISFNELMAKQ